MRTGLIFLTIFFSACSYGAAQNEVLNHKKYWFYHYRLVNDFLAKGDCRGCSEPMNQRAADGPGNPVARWGDQTISLAEYIAVLATEYRLLKNAGQPADTTIQELYFALKAFNRLDQTAESYFTPFSSGYHPPGPADLNGFFMRDDVYSGFLTLHPKLAQGVTSSQPVSETRSDYYNSYSTFNPLDNEMSLDQVCHLYMGFALVSKFLDPGENYQGLALNDLDGNIFLGEEARRITNRITLYMKDTDWLIKNAVSGLNVTRGHDFITWSYGAAQASCYIRELSTGIDPVQLPPVHYCDIYRSVVTELSAPAWNAFATAPGSLYTLNDEDFKVQVLAAIGNSWYSSVTLPPYINLTESALAPRSIIRDYQHLPLLRQVLHGGGNPISNSTYLELINSAPCEGPFCYSYPENCSGFEWSCSDRLYIGDERGGAHGAFNNYGEFNGMAYMLYYNLYYLVQESSMPYINYMDRRVSFTFPTATGIGLAPDIATIEAFNTIVADNTVSSNAAVTYHAGNEITFLPGFEAAAGAEFHALIQPFHCAADGDYRNMNSSGQLSAYMGPTTFIDHANSPASKALPSNFYIPPKAPEALQRSPLTLKPNPNQGRFTIASVAPVHGMIRIFNGLGCLVLEKEMEAAEMDIDMSAFPQGLYVVRIEEQDRIETIRMIHQ